MANYKRFYKKGDWKAACDVCGFSFKASELRLRWDGLMVCAGDWEMRHPQDLIKTVAPTQAVPWTRPFSDEIIGVCSLESVNSVAGIGIAGCMIAGYTNTYDQMYEALYPPTFNPNTL